MLGNIKTAAQWLGRNTMSGLRWVGRKTKISAGLRWLGIKLGIIAPSSANVNTPVVGSTTNVTQSTASSSPTEQKWRINGKAFPYKNLADDLLIHISRFFYNTDFAHSNQVLGHRLYPSELFQRKYSTVPNAPALQVVFAEQAEEKKNEEKHVLNEQFFSSLNCNPRLLCLLEAVEYADYKRVERIIARDPSIIFSHANYVFRDKSSECISPLKLAFKLYDTYMWKIFHESIKKDTLMRDRFVEQMQEQITHIDLSPLFQAYEQYDRQIEESRRAFPSPYDLSKAWLNLGAVQQSTLPVHMLKEFLRETTVFKFPSICQTAATPRPKNCRIYEYSHPAEWKSLTAILSDSGWGTRYALLRGDRKEAWGAGPTMEDRYIITADLKLFRSLLEVRSEELLKLKKSFMLQNRTGISSTFNG